MSAHAHFQLPNAMVQPQLPFLDPLASLGNPHGGLNSGHHPLLQQQQMGLGLSGSAASNGALFPSSNNALFNASSDLNLSQAYNMQDHFQSSGGGGGASRLNPSNFNLNFGNPSNSTTNNMMNGMNPNFR
jgi:hypothetical protein